MANECVGSGAGEAIIVAVAPSQPSIPITEAKALSAERGDALTVFLDWQRLIRQVLLWSQQRQLVRVKLLPGLIKQRLIDLEVSEEAVARWAELVGLPAASDPYGPREAPSAAG